MQVITVATGLMFLLLLQFSGSPMNWNVSFAGLLPNQFNSATINVTDASGYVGLNATVNNFDTFSQKLTS